MGGADAAREGDVTDVKRIANLEVADVDLDGFGKIVRKAGDFDGVHVLLDQSTGLDTCGFAVEVSRNVGGDGGFFVDRAEVGVQGDSGKGVVLDGLEESEAGAVTFDFQVDEDVLRAAVSEEVSEGFRIDLEVDVFSALAVDHGGNPAFAAHLLEASGSAACARGCFE